MTPEERAVIDAALEHKFKINVFEVRNAIADLERSREQPEQPQWIARTAEDVREGDLVRLPAAPDLHARVVFAQPLDWHVRSGGDGHRARFDDVPLEHRKVSLRLEYAGAKLDFAGRPALMELPAGTPVEIQLIPSELQAIELLGGFENRVRMKTEGSNASE